MGDSCEIIQQVSKFCLMILMQKAHIFRPGQPLATATPTTEAGIPKASVRQVGARSEQSRHPSVKASPGEAFQTGGEGDVDTNVADLEESLRLYQELARSKLRATQKKKT